MKYRVLSDMVHRHQPGDVIDDLPGINMSALIYAGHVEELVDEPAPKAKTRKGDDE